MRLADATPGFRGAAAARQAEPKFLRVIDEHLARSAA